MDNNEKELHRLAALGAGYSVYFWSDKVARMDLPLRPLWNPRNDAGDSFRLASDCNLIVDFGNSMVEWPPEVMGKGADKLRATMEAIFMAAVELGKHKQSGI